MKKRDLIDAIEKVRPGISCSSNIFEQSDSIYFNGDSISSYSGEIAVYIPLEIGVKGWVKAVEFQKIIQKMKAEEIELSSVSDKIVIEGGKTKVSFNKVSENVEIPDLGIGEIKRWKKLPDNFCEAIQFCEFSAASDVSRGVLTFIHVIEDLVESCDNFRATRFTLKSKSTDEMFIPRATSKHFSVYKPSHYNNIGGWLHFCNKDTGVVYSVRTCNDKYVSLDKLFKADGIEFDFPSEVKESLSLAEILAEESNVGYKIIQVVVGKNSMKVVGENMLGSVEDSIDIKYTDEPFDFKIPAQSLIAIISSLKKCVVSGDRILFNGDGFRHVIALMKD